MPARELETEGGGSTDGHDNCINARPPCLRHCAVVWLLESGFGMLWGHFGVKREIC